MELNQSVMLKLSQLRENRGQIEGLPSNPRFIRDEKFKKLVRSIEENPEMTALREILVYPFDGTFVVIGGNMRLKAMKELGYKEAPCKVIPESATVEQLKAYTIKDNSGFGEWDFEMLANEWDLQLLEDCAIDFPDVEGISPDLDEKEAEEDNFTEEDAEQAEARVKFGEVWQLGEHRLMCGDSTDINCMNILSGGAKMDLCVTDPPYNVAYEGGTKDKLKIANDNMSEAAFLSFLTAAFAVMTSALRDGASYYCWYASRTHTSFEQALMANGLNVRQQLIWNKNTFTLGRQDYQWKHEPCMYGWKEGAAHYFVDNRTLATVMEDSQTLDFTKMKKAELLDYIKEMTKSKVPTTILDEDKPSRNGEHPTMKPVKLIGRQVRNSSRMGENVLDLFGGSGTTLIACEQLNRKCFMMEYDPHYCDVIIARWEKLTGKKAEKIQG